MRTQKLLVAAAVLAISAATSMAQVYSQNIVGYINLTINNGFNLVANQLNNGAGSNSLNVVFPGSANGSTVYLFNPGTGNFTQDVYDTDGWYDPISGNPSTSVVNPGQGFFFFNPSTNRTVTLVGSVQTGTNAVNVNGGFSLLSSATPESYELTGTNFPTANGLTYYQYSAGSFVQSVFDTGAWADPISGDPVTVKPSVGQGFFMFNPGSATNWIRVFNP